MKTVLTTVLALVCCLAHTSEAKAQAKVKLAWEVAELLLERFGSKMGGNVGEVAARIERLAALYGEEAFVAARKGGASGLTLMEGAAAADGAKAVRALALYGEQGATRILSRPAAMKSYLQWGEAAGNVLVKHPGVAEGLLEKGGLQAAKALSGIGPQSGRRLAMVMEGEIANAAHHPALMEIVAKHGEKAVEFIWSNKATLAGGAALATFLHDPEPFLNGARDLSSVVGENVVKPVTSGIFSLLHYALVAVGILLLAVVGLMYKHGPPKAEAVKLLFSLVKK